MVRTGRPKMSKQGGISLAGHAGNERGMALVIALVMLVLMTILGAWALDTSITDLRISGNFKTTQSAFYAADAGVGLASNPDNLKSTYLQPGSTSDSGIISVGSSTFDATTRFMLKAPLPPGSMYDSVLDDNGNPRFAGIYFAINSEGSALNKSKVTLEAGVAQVVGN